MIELAVLIAALAYLAYDRHTTRCVLERASPDLTELVALVDRLCQRVQAPAVAVASHAAEAMPEGWAPPAVGHDDDEGFMASRMSKEELSEHLARTAGLYGVAG